MKFRSQVFRRAHEIAKATGKAFAICLVKAWECYRLKKLMMKKTVRFCYEKADGTLRHAVGTLQEVFLGDIKGVRPPNPKVFNYYDMDAHAFRCFKSGNLVKVY